MDRVCCSDCRESQREVPKGSKAPRSSRADAKLTRRHLPPLCISSSRLMCSESCCPNSLGRSQPEEEEDLTMVVVGVLCYCPSLRMLLLSSLPIAIAVAVVAVIAVI